VTGYEIERNGAVLPQTVQATEFTDTGLTASTTYAYRVRARDAAGNRSAWSTAATVSTPSTGGGGGTPPPPQVTNLLANGGFETGNLEGRSLDWGLAVSEAAAHTGRYGVRMNGDGRITQSFRTARGRRYCVMARVHIEREITKPSWGGVRVQITNLRNWTELAQRMLTPQDSPIGRWTRIDLSFVAASTQTRIAFENFSGGGRYKASGDDFYCQRVSDSARRQPANAEPPPAVALTAPANGAVFLAPATVNVAATASDADGSVARVEFLVNGTVAATIAAVPYSASLTLSTSGMYALAARSTDDRGAQTTSASVKVTVQAPSGGGSGGGGGGTLAANLLVDPGFESGNLNGWSGSAQATTEYRYSGQWSARITTDSITQTVATTPGETYKLTGWARIASKSGSDWGGFRLGAISWDWKTLAHAGFITQSSAGSGWVKYALTLTATTTQTRIAAGFFGGSALRMTA
jgi:hypothetical protein